MQHIIDGGTDVTKRSAHVTNEMVTTFHLKSKLLWTHDAFVLAFKQTPEATGYTLYTKEMPNGETLSGYMTEDDGKRPLPDGCTLIDSSCQVRSGTKKRIDQNPGEDKEQITSTAKAMCRRALGDQSPHTPRVPVATLRSLAERQQPQGIGRAAKLEDADTPGESHGGSPGSANSPQTASPGSGSASGQGKSLTEVLAKMAPQVQEQAEPQAKRGRVSATLKMPKVKAVPKKRVAEDDEETPSHRRRMEVPPKSSKTTSSVVSKLIWSTSPRVSSSTI